jgi:hypothetical protein
LFADDTSVIISKLNPIEFKSNIDAVLTITKLFYYSFDVSTSSFVILSST